LLAACLVSYWGFHNQNKGAVGALQRQSDAQVAREVVLRAVAKYQALADCIINLSDDSHFERNDAEFDAAVDRL